MRSSLVAVVLIAGSGCGGSLVQVRADNRRLADELATVRSDLRAERRKVKDLERQILLASDRSAPPPLAGAGSPALPIEVLSPDGVTENGTLVGATEDGSEIVYLGDAAGPSVEIDPDDLRSEAPPRPRSRPRLGDLPTSTELREPAPRPAPSPDVAAAFELYRRGQTSLKARDHAAAIDAFRALIARYPTDEYADNAQYWIGEAFYDQKEYARAVSEFRATVATYPLGNKVPDALLKIGMAYAALGEPAKARAALEQVVRQFPKSAPAAIAATRLGEMP